jgi:homoserine kinase
VSPTAATAFAPASVGNVGVGFDILGHALDGVGDRVTASRIDAPQIRIDAIDGRDAARLPREASRNTAGAAVRALLVAAGHDVARDGGIALRIDKGIPYGSGMGGSAASAVAAVVAANALLAAPQDLITLYRAALDGELLASGSRHGDNVAPMLTGGLALAVGERAPLRLAVPAELHCALVHPHQVLETRAARAALAGDYALAEFVAQSGHLALLLTGCARGDPELIAAGLQDVLVEPRRAALVPGFAAVKQAALAAGALGASISGGGPSVFAWCWGRAVADAVATAMRAAFAAAGLASDAHVGPVDAPAARVLA